MSWKAGRISRLRKLWIIAAVVAALCIAVVTWRMLRRGPSGMGTRVPEDHGAVESYPDLPKILAMPASADRGRKLFFDINGSQCGNCHVIAGRGTDFGPDLSQIGRKFSKADILDNILHPSKSIVPGYETYVLRTKSEPARPGEIYVGFLVKKSVAEVVLKDQQRQLIHIPARAVESLAAQTISAMPEGLLANLDKQKVADLLEYLATRR